MASRAGSSSRGSSLATGLQLTLLLALGLGGCVTTGLGAAQVSPWQPVELNTRSNPLDVAFSNKSHGFLVGSNRLILETNDGGASWAERSLDLPPEENFRLISIDFKGDEGWIAGQPGLLLHSTDAGQNWNRLFLDTKLPGEPYLISATGRNIPVPGSRRTTMPTPGSPTRPSVATIRMIAT